MHNAGIFGVSARCGRGMHKVKCYSADQSGLCKLFIEPANALLRVYGGEQFAVR